MLKQRKSIVGLDIGTSKIAAIVGEVNEQGELEIIGIGSYPSRGLKKGVVVDIESTVQSIQRAVEEAELMAGCQIDAVYAGIAGSHIRSINSHGIVAVRDREVYPQDVERVIDAAQAMAIPADQRILHILPQEFLIDNQEGIREPVGMSGVRLEAKVHMVTGAESAAQNIVKCVQRCGLEVDDMMTLKDAARRENKTVKGHLNSLGYYRVPKEKKERPPEGGDFPTDPSNPEPEEGRSKPPKYAETKAPQSPEQEEPGVTILVGA